MKRRLRVYALLGRMAWRNAPGMTAVVGVLTIAAVISSALVAVGLQEIVNLLARGDRDGAIVATVLTACGVGLVYVGEKARGGLQYDLTLRVQWEIEQEMLVTMAGIEGLEHLERPEFLDRVDNVRVHGFELAFSMWGPVQGIASAVRLVISVWLLAAVHPLLVVLPVLAVPALLAANRGTRIRHAANRAVAPANRLEEHLLKVCAEPATAKEVRLSGAGKRLDAIAGERWQDATRILVAAQLRGGALELVAQALFVAGYLGAIAMVTGLALDGRRDVGAIVLVLLLAGQVRQNVGSAIHSFAQMSAMSAIIEDFVWFSDYAEERATHPHAPVPVPDRLRHGISIEGVSFRYPGTDRDVLRELTLTLPAGGVIALVGDNGAGKSTLVKLLCGFHTPTTGRITVDGVPLSDIGIDAWRARTSAAFQDFAKFEFPVRHVVGVGDLPRRDDTVAVTACPDAVHAMPLVDRLPDGLDTQLGRTFDGTDLSHGQWQKLAVARSSMRRAPLLLVLDEPTSAIDASTEHNLFEQYARQAGTAAVTLLISHRFSTVRDADLICVFDDGRLDECGSHDELMARDGRYAQVYRRQAGAYR